MPFVLFVKYVAAIFFARPNNHESPDHAVNEPKRDEE
jgi:hypothetical protein